MAYTELSVSHAVVAVEDVAPSFDDRPELVPQPDHVKELGKVWILLVYSPHPGTKELTGLIKVNPEFSAEIEVHVVVSAPAAALKLSHETICLKSWWFILYVCHTPL